MGVPPPGWRDDGTGRMRYWDGVSWSDRGPDGAGPPWAAGEPADDEHIVPVVVAAVGGVVAGLDLGSGKQLWEHVLGASGARVDLELHRGLVFVAAATIGAAPIVCLDQLTGAVLRWRATFEEHGVGAPGLFVAGGHLIVHGQILVACFTLDGERLWDRERPGDGWMPSAGGPQTWAVGLDDRVHRLHAAPRR